MNKNTKNRWRKRDEVKKEFKEQLIDLARVTRVVKGWRRMRFRATVVIWNEKWKVWLWTWKANEVATAIQKASISAKRNLLVLPLVKWTIAKDVNIKFKWARILIMPACEGTWIIAWGSIRKIAEVAWVHNMLSKRFWTTNKLVNAQAMMEAIAMLSKVKLKKSDIEVEEKKDQKASKEEPKNVAKDTKVADDKTAKAKTEEKK